MLKRVVSAVLALGLVLSGTGIRVSGAPKANSAKNVPQVSGKLQNLLEKNKEKAAKVTRPEAQDPEEEVRVIIELSVQPHQLAKWKTGQGTLAKIDREQSAFFSEARRAGIAFSKLKTFRQVFNGTSGKVKRKDLEALKQLPGVKSVSIARTYARPQPLMAQSADLVGAPQAWNLNYKGEGLVVGVIDSGFDPTHPDFVLTNPAHAELDASEVAAQGMPGQYVSAKFPYAYNYFDRSNSVLESGESHGQHVAGTIAANGELKGVAPEAQLLALKVFSSDPTVDTTYEDIYLEALEDGVLLGADVLNLSLGAPAGFTSFGPSALETAVSNAKASGVLVAMAAGNDKNLAEGAPTNAASWMPDQGLISDPAVARDSMVVAASDKVIPQWEKILIDVTTPDGFRSAVVLPAPNSPDPVTALSEGGYPVVYAGLGSPEDFAGVDYAGKIVMIWPGSYPLAEQLERAQSGGAIALIVGDHYSDGELMIMAGGENATIPFMAVDFETAGKLSDLRFNGGTVAFRGIPNSDPTIKLADFSTWGATNDLRLKPEITAPGLNIVSTQNGQAYGVMSGTSMATPHLAGGAVVIRDYFEHSPAFQALSRADQMIVSKQLLMNSADVLFEQGTARSPRVQGAGLMNLGKALEARTLAYQPITREAKLELKEVTSPLLKLNLTVQNIGGEGLDYTAEVHLLTDAMDNGLYTERSRKVPHSLSGDEAFRVEAGSSRAVSLTVDFAQGGVSKEQFIEGFVVLTDSDGRTTSVPFMGFYGDWNKPLVLDAFGATLGRGQDPVGTSFFDTSGLICYSPYYDEAYWLKNRRVELNPRNDVSYLTGRSNILPSLSFLRSADEVTFSLLNSSKTRLETIGSYQGVPKMSRIYAGAPTSYLMEEGFWEDDLPTGPLPDGKYFYEIKTKINYDQGTAQARQIPVLIDHKAPVVSNVRIEGNYLYFDATDGASDLGVGVNAFVVSTSKTDSTYDMMVEKTVNNRYRIDIWRMLGKSTSIYIYAYDNLYNESITSILQSSRKPAPPVVQRIAGDTRYSTAVEISKKTFVTADTIILVNGVSGIDALLGGPLSAVMGAPILLTEPAALRSVTKTEITRLKAKHAIILGGEQAVPAGIVTALKGMGLTVERIGGTTRFKTSILVDQKIRSITGRTDRAVVANGYTMFDALTAGPGAAKNGCGILFNDGKSIDMIKDSLKEANTVYLTGGQLVQTAEVEAALQAPGRTVVRLAGANRYATAAVIADQFFNSTNTIVIANGEKPYDALTGTLLCHVNHGPVVLTPAAYLHADTKAYLIDENPDQVFILGGLSAISTATQTSIQQICN
ncbi:S8 family serine peptidase [Clostridiaceae bacterium HFYG-1003]|nr:S8 family serine peptidase [Clostridiaceae bacterium HFYG-1003]